MIFTVYTLELRSSLLAYGLTVVTEETTYIGKDVSKNYFKFELIKEFAFIIIGQDVWWQAIEDLCVLTASARIRQVTVGGLALINKHKSGCMMDRETNIHDQYKYLQ